MSLNYRDIDLLLEEMDLEHSFLQEIIQFDFQHILFQFYKPGKEQLLLISLAPKALRLHLTDRKRRALAKPPRFTAFMKSRIKGSRLNRVTQLGRERIIRMDFSKGDESFLLYIKLWENNSNLLLCDGEGKILDSFSRRPKRGEVPGEIWSEDSIKGKSKEREPQDFPGEGSLNQRVAQHYQRLEREGQLKQLREKLIPLIESEISSVTRRLEKQRKILAAGESEQLKELGDLILSNQHLITRGDRWLDLDDGETARRIELNPKLDPWANAQEYYKRYKKKKRQEEDQDSAPLEERLAQLESRLEELESCQKIDLLKKWLSEAQQKKIQVESKITGLRFQSGPFTISVGRNARENDTLLRQARGNDTWLHTRDYPGGYVFINGPKGKSIPLEVLLDGGNLALIFSKAKELEQVDLHYTQVKYLRRAKNGPRGLVIPTQEKNLTLRKDEKRLERLYEGKDLP